MSTDITSPFLLQLHQDLLTNAIVASALFGTFLLCGFILQFPSVCGGNGKNVASAPSGMHFTPRQHDGRNVVEEDAVLAYFIEYYEREEESREKQKHPARKQNGKAHASQIISSSMHRKPMRSHEGGGPSSSSSFSARPSSPARHTPQKQRGSLPTVLPTIAASSFASSGAPQTTTGADRDGHDPLHRLTPARRRGPRQSPPPPPPPFLPHGGLASGYAMCFLCAATWMPTVFLAGILGPWMCYTLTGGGNHIAASSAHHTASVVGAMEATGKRYWGWSLACLLTPIGVIVLLGFVWLLFSSQTVTPPRRPASRAFRPMEEDDHWHVFPSTHRTTPSCPPRSASLSSTSSSTTSSVGFSPTPFRRPPPPLSSTSARAEASTSRHRRQGRKGWVPPPCSGGGSGAEDTDGDAALSWSYASSGVAGAAGRRRRWKRREEEEEDSHAPNASMTDDPSHPFRHPHPRPPPSAAARVERQRGDPPPPPPMLLGPIPTRAFTPYARPHLGGPSASTVSSSSSLSPLPRAGLPSPDTEEEGMEKGKKQKHHPHHVEVEGEEGEDGGRSYRLHEAGARMSPPWFSADSQKEDHRPNDAEEDDEEESDDDDDVEEEEENNNNNSRVETVRMRAFGRGRKREGRRRGHAPFSSSSAPPFSSSSFASWVHSHGGQEEYYPHVEVALLPEALRPPAPSLH